MGSRSARRAFGSLPWLSLPGVAWADGMGGPGAALASAATGAIALCTVWLGIMAVGLVSAWLARRRRTLPWRVLNGVTLVTHAAGAMFFVWLGFALHHDFFFLATPALLTVPQVILTILPVSAPAPTAPARP